MSFLYAISFNFQQIIAVLGLVQAVYALVYIAFRSGNLAKAWTVIIYFLFLVVALFSDFSLEFFSKYKTGIFYFSSAFWLCLPVLGYLICLQIIHIQVVIKLRHIIFVGIPVLFIMLMNFASITAESENLWIGANLLSLFAGSVSLFAVIYTLGKDLDIKTAKENVKQRYWLVICLILTSIGLLGLFLFEQSQLLSRADLIISRDILALMFIYLISTSLFRLYPQAVFMSGKKSGVFHDPELVSRLQYILEREKLYQEQNFGRKELATELGISEAIASELVNTTYQKSIPQLLKEHRVEDAKILLKQTRMPMKDIATESGFGSLTSFNRTFQEIVGQTPTKYRRG